MTTLSRPTLIRTTLLTLGVALGALLLFPRPALARDGADKAAAEALFAQGKKAFDAKKFAKACQKFDASNKLDPAVGTLLFLGECNERLGKTASAWASFKEASALAGRVGDDKRKQIAEVRIAALEPQVSKLAVVVNDPAEGMSIRRDGVDLPSGSWGAALPVDAGEHRIEASAPGKKAWSSTIAVSDGGETFTVHVPTLVDVGGAMAPAPAPTGDVLPPPPPPTPPDEGGSNLGTALQITGLTVAGLGVAGIVVGSVFGVLAKGSNDDSIKACRTATLCSPEGLALREDARSQANVSTAMFVVGGVLAAGGVTLFLLAPDDDEGSAGVGHLALDANLGPGQAGLTLHGSF